MPEPILIICYSFPPVHGIGGRRWAKFAKALARRGHVVHVIRAEASPKEARSLWWKDVQDQGIIHHPLPRRYPIVLSKRPLSGIAEKLAYRWWSLVMPLTTPGNWLDKTIHWRHALEQKMDTLMREHGIRQVIVTGAPFRLLWHVARIKRSWEGHRRFAFIADLRDPWAWEGRGYGLSALGSKRVQWEREAERLVMASADRILVPSVAMRDHLKDLYPDQAGKMVHLPHPVDPDDLDHARGMLPPDDVVRFFYAGSFYESGAAELFLERLLDGLDLVRRENAARHAQVRVDLHTAGHDVQRWSRLIAGRGHQEQVRFHPPLDPRDVAVEIARSHYVIIHLPAHRSDHLSTKFGEIVHLGRPIIHVGEAGRVREFLERGQHGLSFSPSDLPRRLADLILGRIVIPAPVHPPASGQLLDALTDQLQREALAPLP